MRNWKAPKVGEKFRINVPGGFKWTVKISVVKNDGRSWTCYWCYKPLKPGEMQGRVGGTHFCLSCVDKNIIE